MTAALIPAIDGEARTDLATMTLAECPDLWTAIAAGIAHGLKPRDAIRTAFHKHLHENADAMQAFGLANFYACVCGGVIDGAGHCDRDCGWPQVDTSRKAFVNLNAFVQYLVIADVERERALTSLRREVSDLRRQLPAATTP